MTKSSKLKKLRLFIASFLHNFTTSYFVFNKSRKIENGWMRAVQIPSKTSRTVSFVRTETNDTFFWLFIIDVT